MKKMWEGRFKKPTGLLMEQFNRSLTFDIRMYAEDIKGSKAYASALAKVGILTQSESRKIRKALTEISKLIETGRARFLSQDEDIHMAVERLLVLSVGSMGEKIHTGRSRNDQVATDMRLYVMRTIRRIMAFVGDLQKALVFQAEKHTRTLMPGYTHLQQAQPIRLAHYLLSLFFGLQRSLERLAGAYDTADLLPLGAGAIAGNGFPVDRRLLARELGFTKIAQNSIDAVSSRDFVLEFLAASAILMTDLSRYAEDLIIWSTSEFGFVEIDDAFATGSSMMPQKKNPDSLELIRGKTGRVVGNLMQLLTVIKGLPLAYSKDLQEDKEALFDTCDTLCQVLPVMEGVVRTASFSPGNMEADINEWLLATDLADMLVNKGVPFREAHASVGKLCQFCLQKRKAISQITAKEASRFSRHLSVPMLKSLSPKKSVERRNIDGGTGLRAVEKQIRLARKLLASESKP